MKGSINVNLVDIIESTAGLDNELLGYLVRLLYIELSKGCIMDDDIEILLASCIDPENAKKRLKFQLSFDDLSTTHHIKPFSNITKKIAEKKDKFSNAAIGRWEKLKTNMPAKEKKPKEKKEPKERISNEQIEEFVANYNNICVSLSKCTAVESRAPKIAKRLRFKPMDYWIEVFKKLESTPFMTGKNKNGWKANIDWVIANDINSVKLIEGKYDSSNISGYTGNQTGYGWEK